jgi:hypothetical protein
MAYERQSHSLRYVQTFGPALEKNVSAALGWPGGKVIYYERAGVVYKLQVDSCWPNVNSPQAVASVTYCKPDKPGHSNENKLQLKLGELMLVKARFPEIRSVLVIGGNRETWLPYVLRAFNFFFDRTVFAWEEDFENKINEIRDNPGAIPLRHAATWKQLAGEWSTTKLWDGEPIDSSLREGVWTYMREIGREGELPEDISNEIFRLCMQTAFDRHKATRGRNGHEWTNYLNDEWDKLWQSRSFFNPGEAAIQLSLSRAGFAYLGALAQDVAVPSLIHYLGGEEVDNTKVSEDFILYSRKLDKPVFIQSKSTGGGLGRHGKNIQNRTKEQLARSLFYRGSVDEKGQIILRPKDYYWIGLLDGDWGVTRVTPLKYIHMLQWAGYDYLLAADSLVTDDFSLNPIEANPLVVHLQSLECLTDRTEFESKWEEWRKTRFKRL